MATEGREQQTPETTTPSLGTTRVGDDVCPDCEGSGRLAAGTSCPTCGWSDEGGAAPNAALPEVESAGAADSTKS